MCEKQRTFSLRLLMQHATTISGAQRILTENNYIKLLLVTENCLPRAPMIFMCYPQAHFLLPKRLPILLGLIATSHVQQICDRNMQQIRNSKILPHINNNNKIISTTQI